MRTGIALLLMTLLAVSGCSGDTPSGSVPDGGAGSTPDTPVSVPDGWPEGPVYVSGTETNVSGEPGRIIAALGVTGDLPTPCAQPQWDVSDDGRTVAVDLWSVSDPSEVCTQVLEPFEIEIGLGTFESGRTIELNGEVVGDFSA